MNWIIFAIVNCVWIASVLIVRHRYRTLLKEAIDTLDGVYHAMPAYFDKRKVGRVISDLKAETGL